MDGTHQRMLEAISKDIHIYYLCVTVDHARVMADKAESIYSPYGYNRTGHRDFRTKKGKLLEFRGLNRITPSSLMGFQGCVLVHPDCYRHPHWREKPHLQENIINANVRTRPWQP
ncbi:hypothetical protein HYO99_gp54 [Roseobacter phage RD-1410W1-01]|uniref:Uncharacterized protein n=1 Tax=Roseobacter phage RD-1410W1-01 TaxID=1815984 RepID=A0A191VYK1_9CAUD|nr:hypothetical protein HYO99_gp54 [Roseobacter phage RD-1410W1-01]ANJ20788.1 hypothetical protein RDp01_gp54 [Roseobacter phage RD-1410W1-01]